MSHWPSEPSPSKLYWRLSDLCSFLILDQCVTLSALESCVMICIRLTSFGLGWKACNFLPRWCSWPHCTAQFGEIFFDGIFAISKLGLYRTSCWVQKSGKFSKFRPSGNQMFSFTDTRLLTLSKVFFFYFFSKFFRVFFVYSQMHSNLYFLTPNLCPWTLYETW